MKGPLALVLGAAALVLSAGAASGEVALGTDSGPEPRLEVDTRIHVAPIILTSFSAVAIAVGAGLGWQADQYYDDWEAARDAGDPQGEMDGIADDVRSHSIAADVLMFGGAAGAAIGIVWWIVAATRDRSGGERGKPAAFRPILLPGQAGAIVEF